MRDAELEKGVFQAQTGDFEGAVITLDSVARRLSGTGGRTREMARTYVYLSIAYQGLNQDRKARALFLEAWNMDKGMELSAQEFPLKVLEFFEGAKKSAESDGTQGNGDAGRPSTPRSVPSPLPPSAGTKGGGSSSRLIVGGIAAAAGGVALAAGGSSPPKPTPAPIPLSSLDGMWVGANITFRVVSGALVSLDVLWPRSPTCTISGVGYGAFTISIPIQSGLTFASNTGVVALNGRFTSSSIASGTFEVTTSRLASAPVGCGVINSDWVATKNGS